MDEMMRNIISNSSNQRILYLPGLDGLRAIAVLAVIFYHANVSWAVGGYLGVEVFFVISGYLISSLLLREYLASQRVALSQFWLRRARRLLPALCLLLAAVVPLAGWLAPDALPRLREDIPGALLYISNWVFISREIPYFEQFGRPPLLQHLWSLAVEEQFYLIWPLVLWGILRIFRPRSSNQTFKLALPVLLLAGITFALTISMYDPQADPSRVYYGTDTRASGFLLGAGLAMLWKPGNGIARRSWVVETASFLGALGLFWVFGRLHEYEAFLYRGGFLLAASLTCLVILAVSNPRTHLSRLLGCRPLRWLGTRSYGIYLWHWPLMIVWNWGSGSAQPDTITLALQLILTGLLAELSYRWIEQPIRRYGMRIWWSDSTKLLGGLRANATAVAGMLVVAGYIVVQPTAAAPSQANATASKLPVPTPSLEAAADPNATEGYPSYSSAHAQAAAKPNESLMISNTIAVLEDVPETTNTLQITFIGDSIMESVEPWLGMEFSPGSYCVDALRNRRMQDVVELIPQLAEGDCLASTVAIHLGTNVPFEDEVFDDVMRSLLEQDVVRVLFINVRRPAAWEAIVNNQILKGVNRWPQAELIDWHALSEDQAGWFCEDSVHPSYTGAAAYVEIIHEALRNQIQ
jgi:peptidoglycan/LPS O-acetylase OafA/YrhL